MDSGLCRARHHRPRPGDRRGDRDRSRGDGGRRPVGDRGGPSCILRGAVALHEAGRARCGAQANGRDPRGAQGQARRDHRRPGGCLYPTRRTSPGGRRNRDRPLQRGQSARPRPLGRIVAADRRPERHGGKCSRARTRRRRRGDHALQLSLHVEHREGLSGDGGRLPGRPEAPSLDAARRVRDCPGSGRSRDSAGRIQRDYRRRRSGR